MVQFRVIELQVILNPAVVPAFKIESIAAQTQWSSFRRKPLQLVASFFSGLDLFRQVSAGITLPSDPPESIVPIQPARSKKDANPPNSV
jgi:hypothetical protein